MACMVMAGKERIVLVAAFGSWQLLAMHQAWGGQPFDKLLAAPSRESTLDHDSNAGRSAGVPLPSGRLDLRPPSQTLDSAGGMGVDAVGSVSEAARRSLFALQSVPRFEAVAVAPKADSPSRIAQPAARATVGHIMSPMETLAHNFRQQGLPVARLFENKDSLVHLGLDPKGKPGLWVLHRLH